MGYLTFNIAVVGIGGLLRGSYGIQHARLLAPNSNIIAIDHSVEKLQLAEKLGAEYVNSKESQDIKSEIFKITEEKGVSAAIDFVGAEETIRSNGNT